VSSGISGYNRSSPGRGDGIGARRTMPCSEYDDVRHPCSGVWRAVVDFLEFRCASLQATLRRASGAFRRAEQIPKTIEFSPRSGTREGEGAAAEGRSLLEKIELFARATKSGHREFGAGANSKVAATDLEH